MISIIITAWEEPEEVKECLKRFIHQKNLKESYEILAIAPDNPTKREILEYVKKYPKKVKFISQPREKGKNEMINLLIKKSKGSILIFTDGDVFVNDTAVAEILKAYEDSRVGAVTGRIIPRNSRKTLFGYWAHLLTYGAHRIRKERHDNQQFLECSGYLYSIRKGIIEEIPLDVAEDSIMPLMIWKRSWKIAYIDKAEGYVLYPENFQKWIGQKVRTAKSHELLNKYGGRNVRMKTFKNELIKGILWSITYPKNIKEFYFTLLLYLARLETWRRFFVDTRIRGKHYGETWEKIHGSLKKANH